MNINKNDMKLIEFFQKSILCILCLSLFITGCKKEGEAPVVTTSSAKIIDQNSAVFIGKVNSDGGSPITARGFLVSTVNQKPDLWDYIIKCNTGIGTFSSTYYGIGNGNTIYVRAFASNLAGTTYGDVIVLEDTNYRSVTIGTQVWMVDNLKTLKYRNGETIPNITDLNIWSNLSSAAQCDYENTPAYTETYGRLYNWYAVNDPRNIAPFGWHIPSKEEWLTLINYLGGEEVAGDKLKESGYLHWYYDGNCSTFASNETGFTALPGGCLTNNVEIDSEWYFAYVSQAGYWWTSSEKNSSHASCIEMMRFDGHVFNFDDSKNRAYSVRCIKD
jgi:uncharacterized protein (TIGR02145 family)